MAVLPFLILASTRPFDDGAGRETSVPPGEVSASDGTLDGREVLMRSKAPDEPARWFGIIGCVLLLMGGRYRR